MNDLIRDAGQINDRYCLRRLTAGAFFSFVCFRSILLVYDGGTYIQMIICGESHERAFSFVNRSVSWSETVDNHVKISMVSFRPSNLLNEISELAIL